MRKNIVIIGTGGTIAGIQDNPERAEGYTSGALNAADLVKSIQETEKLSETADIKTEEFCNIDSCAMTPDIWLSLSLKTEAFLKDESTGGIVITHGTDTMEETAFFLALTVARECERQKKSVILTGAMHPATAKDADGPKNLIKAIELASSTDTVPGVHVVMNGQIYNPLRLVKTNPHDIDAFSEAVGAPDPCPCFDLRKITTLPSVEILDMYPGADLRLLKYVLEEVKPAGIVLSAPGNGTLTDKTVQTIRESSYKGIIFRASRTGRGPVTDALFDDKNISKKPANLLCAGDMTPQKVRVLLMLLLASGEFSKNN